MAKATREAYGIALAKLIEENEKVVVLDADLTKSTKTADAKKVCPERHFNMGIAEGNMMTAAAGMAASGYTVFASSFSIFATGRAWEQVRNSIGYPHMNVKICGTHAGISVGEDGASHQALEDIALMRVIPGMSVYQPCDEQETYAIINHVASIQGPCYVRLGRGKVDDIYPEGTKFEIGKISTVNQGSKVAILATGLMVQEAMKAKEELIKEGINPTVVNVSCLKPVDREGIVGVLKNHEIILTAEEHSVIGGLGSLVQEIACEEAPIKVTKIGTQDTFGESGTANALLEKYGCTAKAIVEKVRELTKVGNKCV